VVAVVLASRHERDAHMHRFNAWMTRFDKSYESEAEFEHAFHNFVASVARVDANNKRTGKNYYGLTKFSDMSPEEFSRTYLRAKHSSKTASISRSAGARVLPKPHKHQKAAIPDTFDWRTTDPFPVTAVKDQGQCGSCWAFSATENIESMHVMKHGKNKKVELSPEQIVDCDQGRGDQGCQGGDTPTAFQYVTAQGGLDTNASYPYTAGGGQAGTCQFDASNVGAKINNFTWAIPLCTDSCDNQPVDDLRSHLTNVGPFAICVYAQTWQDYQGGSTPFDDASCVHAYNQLDHCVQLVGYDQNQKYWIVRNSWNTNWGNDGYIYIDSTVAGGNLCGIADEVNFANAL